MRPLYQVQTMSPLLKHLDSLRDVLHPILISLNQTIAECQCWLKDDDRKTFKEMMLQLEDTNSLTLQQVSALLGSHMYGSDSSGQTEAKISSINPPITSTNVVALLEPSQQDNTQDKTCSKFVTIEEFQSLLHKLDITDMTTGSLERKYLQIEENINTVNDKLQSFKGKGKSQLKLSKQQDRRVDEVEKNMDVLTEKIEEQSNATQKLSDNMRQMMTSLQEINKSSCDNKKHIEELSVVTQDLIKKTNDHKTSVQEISDSLSITDEKITNGELKLTEKLNALEKKYCRSRVVFRAKIKPYLSLTIEDVIREFSEVLCSTSGCFQPTTGEFTVPTDGLYCISLNGYTSVKGEAAIALYRKRLSTKTKTSETQKPTTLIDCTDKTSGYDGDKYTEDFLTVVSVTDNVARGSRVTVLELQEGDKLYLKVSEANRGVTLTNSSLFGCFQICS